MITYNCDACGREILHFEPVHEISIPVHISTGLTKYIDANNEGVSGRSEEFELCQSCVNKVHKAAWDTMEAIKDKS